MQKKIIALAVAGLASGFAVAQSNVTIYGIVDSAYTYAKGKTTAGAETAFSGIRDGGMSGSRLGFKGEETLGNGLKAIFLLEFGFDNESSGGLYRNRQTYVGLDSNAGTFTVGRQYSPSFFLLGRSSANSVTDVQPLNSLLGSGGGFLNSVGTMRTDSASRWNNALNFTSKNYAGFQARAIYAFGETASNQNKTDLAAAGAGLASAVVPGAAANTISTTDNGKVGLSLSYTNGPFTADAIYQSRQKIRTTYLTSPDASGEGKNLNEWWLGAAYDFQVVKAYASFLQAKNKNTANASAYDGKLWSVGVKAPFGAHSLGLEYAQASYDQSDAQQAVAASQIDGKTKSWGLQYVYDFSKRTNVYAGYAWMKNDSNAVASSPAGIGTGGLGQSSWAVSSGIRHQF